LHPSSFSPVDGWSHFHLLRVLEQGAPVSVIRSENHTVSKIYSSKVLPTNSSEEPV
jgi:hypothetical protein